METSKKWTRTLCAFVCLLLVAAGLSAQTTHKQEEASAGGDPVQQTRDEMLMIGTAMQSYVVNAVGGTLAGTPYPCLWSGSPFNRDSLPVISHSALEAILVPQFISDLPQFDAWGNPYEFQLTEDLVSSRVTAVLSPGADGLYQKDSLYAGAYTSDPNDDLIWADAAFVRQPPLDPAFAREQADQEIRTVGRALLSWLVDQIGGTPLGADGVGAPSVTLNSEAQVTHQTVVDALIPTESFYYTRCVPEFDPWGQPYEYYIDMELIGPMPIMAIRTAGADGVVEGDTYDQRPVTDPNADLVWADGIFYRFPTTFADDFESGDTTAWSETVPPSP